MWTGLFEWMESEPLKKHLIAKSDFKNINIVQNTDEVIALLKPLIDNFYSDN
jgi:predicted Rossmann-fold nucleotide-binding protein